MVRSTASRFLFLCMLAAPGPAGREIQPPISVRREEDSKTLSIGASAPDFHLKGVDGKIYSLNSFSKADILVVVFMCNHCPTSQAYEQRMIRLTRDPSNGKRKRSGKKSQLPPGHTSR